jgi:hypothetical protein
MVVLGSFSRGVGASSSRRANLSGGTGGVAGGRKTVYGASNNTTSKPVTNIKQEKKWGFYDALTGRGDQRNNIQGKEQSSGKKTFANRLGDVKYEIVDSNKKGGAVRYKSTGYKKGKIYIEKDAIESGGSKGRKELAVAFGKLSKRGSLNKTTGKLRSGDLGGFTRAISELKTKKIHSKAGRSGKTFSKGTMKDFLK